MSVKGPGRGGARPVASVVPIAGHGSTLMRRTYAPPIGCASNLLRRSRQRRFSKSAAIRTHSGLDCSRRE